MQDLIFELEGKLGRSSGVPKGIHQMIKSKIRRRSNRLAPLISFRKQGSPPLVLEVVISLNQSDKEPVINKQGRIAVRFLAVFK